MERRPIPEHDRLPRDKQLPRRKPIPLLIVRLPRSRQEIPQLVVVPEAIRQHVVNFELVREAPAGPHARRVWQLGEHLAGRRRR